MERNGTSFNKNNEKVYEIKDGIGIIKEYGDYGELKFEGEYFNGERNGREKEYSDGKLKFEGEYFNGERNGRGKEYNSKNNLEFEGAYLNEERFKWKNKRILC